MRTFRTLLVLCLAAGCAAHVPGDKEALADPSFHDGADAPADEYSRRLDYRGAIAFGETVDGTYSDAGYAGYAFVGRAGATVSLALDGIGNDPVLYVYGPKLGETWSYARRRGMNDDHDGLDSFLELELPEDGTYLVLAREYWGEAGSFALTLSCAGEDCRAECSPDCPAGAECDRIVCIRAPCPSFCAVEGDEPEPPPPASCGSRGLPACPDGQFCNWAEDALCGATDIPGACTTIPTVCTRDVRPVCGCDGSTYSNACNAHARGVSVAREGACETEPRGCTTSGCSGQVCIEEGSPPVITTCDARPEYACLAHSRCERQPDGQCGWTPTPEQQSCLDRIAGDCRTAGCPEGRWCSFCWGRFQCIPDGAVC
jgi:hypothetical protein